MCVAVPSKVIQVSGKTATVDLNGVILKADTTLLDEVKAGDYVIIHAGFAIQKLDEHSAEETIQLIREARLSSEGPPY